MQMNHSAAFWKVRNQYADELRGLWSKNYTGDSFWGGGKTLLSEQYENTGPSVTEIMPRSLCGGTYRSRGRKRKRKGEGPDKKTLNYAERQQRRITKKFGTNGVALGDDAETRIKLEHGVKVKAKPRVAGSTRGRELRAQAALARFGQQKEEEKPKTEEEAEKETESETDDECEAVECGEEALNNNGSRVLDGKGNSMVRVCEDEDQDDVYVKQEMQELQDLEGLDSNSRRHPECTDPVSSRLPERAAKVGQTQKPNGHTAVEERIASSANDPPVSNSRKVSDDGQPHPESIVKARACPICSVDNDPSAATCMICSHVLNTSKVHGFWQCQSSTCSGTEYLNADDTVLCGICGARRQNN